MSQNLKAENCNIKVEFVPVNVKQDLITIAQKQGISLSAFLKSEFKYIREKYAKYLH